ncbi:hypothetical protein AAMO2058_001120000 [Amorphochlora amoebiformis]
MPRRQKRRGRKGLTEEDLKKQEEKRVLEEKRSELLSKFWEIAKKKRSKNQQDLRMRQRRMRNLEEKHSFEMKVYKEKIKHLLHEQFASVVDRQIDAQRQLKLEETQHRESNHIESQNSRLVKVGRKTKQVDVKHFSNRLTLEHQKHVMELREEYEHKQNELIMHNRQTIARLRKEREAEQEQKTEKIAILKDKFIDHLMDKHKIVFEDIKAYYRDVTLLNLEVIKSHKDQVGEMKLVEQQLAKEVHQVTNANKKLSLPLRMNRKLALKLKSDFELYKKEKILLNESLKYVQNLEKKIKTKKWEQEVLIQKLEQVEKRKDKVDKKLAVACDEVQQRTGFKNLILEKKKEALSFDLDLTNAALREIIVSTDLPTELVGNLKFTVEDVESKRSKEIEEEEDRRIHLRKKYYETIKTYEMLLKKYDIPLEELGFVPAAV